MMLFLQISLSIYALFVLLTLRHIFFNFRNSSNTVSWMMVVTFIPIIGVLLYRLIGRNVKRDRIFQGAKIFNSNNNQPLIYNKMTAQDLKQHFFEDTTECDELTVKSFKIRQDRNMVMESFSRLTSPLL